MSTIKKVSSWFMKQPLFLRIFFGVVFGIIAGPGLIGFLSEYATYFYALSIGIRPPLEGIPYLKATIVAASLVFALLGTLIFIFARLALTSITGNMLFLLSFVIPGGKKVIRADGNDMASFIMGFQKLKPISAILIFLLGSVIIWSIVFYNNQSSPNDLRITAAEKATLVSVVFTLVWLTIWRIQTVWWVAGLLTLSCYFVALYFIFNTKHYSSFLREIGYGGGTKIELEYKTTFLGKNTDEFYLLLRTSDYLVLLSPSNPKVTEVPIDVVGKINYKLGRDNREFIDITSLVPNEVDKKQ